MEHVNRHMENFLHRFQRRVRDWVEAAFGRGVADDLKERNHRFLEEALELVQSTGCTREEAHMLVDYVFDRPVGETFQEMGGVLTTFHALAAAVGLNAAYAGEAELARCWENIEKIRAKQATKPRNSPLPGKAPAEPRRGISGMYARAFELLLDGCLDIGGGYAWQRDEANGQVVVLEQGVKVMWFDLDYWNAIKAGTARVVVEVDGSQHQMDITAMVRDIPEWVA